MDADEHDSLWDLLGQARRPDVSPFFARDVLREIRRVRQKHRGLVAWFLRSWRVAVPATAAAIAVVVSTAVLRDNPKPQHNPLLAQIVSNPDYDVINHLDELSASEENALWLEASAD